MTSQLLMHNPDGMKANSRTESPKCWLTGKDHFNGYYPIIESSWTTHLVDADDLSILQVTAESCPSEKALAHADQVPSLSEVQLIAACHIPRTVIGRRSQPFDGAKRHCFSSISFPLYLQSTGHQF